MRINLKSMFLCGQAVARVMVKQHSGSIINMSSVNAELAIPNQVPYVVSKGAINQLTKVMSLNLVIHGIRVNGIGPGTILTELAKKAVMSSPESRHTILSRTPMGRCGEPEVASIAAFLASDDASYMTGQTLYVDGGRLALNYTVAGQRLRYAKNDVCYRKQQLDTYLATQHNLTCLHYSPPRK
jgi:NAD(P)-dependent dehydrogenase (short-subunit alcohol dehydrogenase family)